MDIKKYTVEIGVILLMLVATYSITINSSALITGEKSILTIILGIVRFFVAGATMFLLLKSFRLKSDKFNFTGNKEDAIYQFKNESLLLEKLTLYTSIYLLGVSFGMFKHTNKWDVLTGLFLGLAGIIQSQYLIAKHEKISK